MQTLVKCLSAYTSDKFISIVCGDFNLPKIDLYTYTGPTDALHTAVLSFVVESSLQQIVLSHTRLQDPGYNPNN